MNQSQDKQRSWHCKIWRNIQWEIGDSWRTGQTKKLTLQDMKKYSVRNWWLMEDRTNKEADTARYEEMFSEILVTHGRRKWNSSFSIGQVSKVYQIHLLYSRSSITRTKFPFPWSTFHWNLPPVTRILRWRELFFVSLQSWSYRDVFVSGTM